MLEEIKVLRCEDCGCVEDMNSKCACDEYCAYEMASDEYIQRDDPFATKEINTVHQDEQFDPSEDHMWNEDLPF